MNNRERGNPKEYTAFDFNNRVWKHFSNGIAM